MRRLELVSLVVVTVGLAAETSSGDWPQFHYAADRSGFNHSEAVLDSSNVSQLGVGWRTTISEAPVTPPVVAGGKVFVGSNDGKVYALDAATGAILWSGATGASIPFSPAVDSGRVYVGSDDTSVYAFPVDCSTPCAPLWSTATLGRVTTAPAVVNGIVYAGAGRGTDGQLWAFDATTGNVLWTADTSSAPIGLAVLNDVVFAGGAGLQAFPAHCTTPCAPLWFGTNGGDSLPAAAGDAVYVDVGYVNNGFNAYPIDCGDPCSPLWIGATNSGSRFTVPAIASGLVYRADQSGTLDAYPSACSTLCLPVWSTYLPAGVSSPAVANGVVYAGSYDGNLHAFDAATGSYLTSVNVGEPTSTPAIADGVVYVSTYRGTLSNDVGRVVALVRNPVDDTPPILQLSPDITAGATDSTGALVFYSVSAEDNLDPNPVVTCQPPSGQVFPVGSTTVRCVAEDASGNSASGTFNVTVLPPWEVSLRLVRLGTVRSKTGATTVGGTVSCSRSGSISLFVQLEQVISHSLVSGAFFTSLSCSPSRTPWSATMWGSPRPFRAGLARLSASAFGCELNCASVNSVENILLLPRP